jgi:adenine-specific DNA-methyltransferase
MDFRHPYLTDQLIAYIGCKRALLPFLHGVLTRLVPDPARATFLDPLAGTGAVSRLARLMGFAVHANDWERYSFVINSCHLGLGARDLPLLFRGRGGVEGVLKDLNRLPALPEVRAYIGRHYAPRATETADWRTERLFYTSENALTIDAVRERIEELYPGEPAEPEGRSEKVVLLAALLYEAATHTNTSGVFKACHRGFGGHGRDALKRIMAPIRLAPPVLIDAPGAARMECADARAFLAGCSGDLCYLDPPYASHQYGSNYFMLNTIALWDKPPVSDERGADGRLRLKAGIRSDWARTRSLFCYRDTALAAMREVVQAADCRYLVLSYSDEGLVGLEELCDLLTATGNLSIHSTGHVKYPGGKQSLARTTRNQELALVVDRRGRQAAPRAESVRRALWGVRIEGLMAGSFAPERVKSAFALDGDGITVGPGEEQRLPMRHFWRFRAEVMAPRFDSGEEAERFAARLSLCAVRDAAEEVRVLLEIVRAQPDIRERKALLKEALRVLNKLAHRKYRGLFAEALAAVRAAVGADPANGRLSGELDRIEERAGRRFRAASHDPA